MGTSLETGASILFFEGRDWKSFHTASANTGRSRAKAEFACKLTFEASIRPCEAHHLLPD